MELYEYIQEQRTGHKVQIFATDIDAGAIDSARIGVYSENIDVDVSPERLNRFFIKKGNSCKIKDDIRQLIIFSSHNLIKDPPFLKMDLISCRNVMIYMNSHLQKKVMSTFHYALKPGGFLFLGPSEGIGENEDLYKVVDKKWKIYEARRADMALRSRIEMPAGDISPARDFKLAGERKPVELKVAELTEKILLNEYSPPCAVVNENGDILHFHGRTGNYLEPAAGRARLNITDMAREGLKLELLSALRKAAADKKDALFEAVRVKSNGGYNTIDLEVKYINSPEHFKGLLLVIFRELKTKAPVGGDKIVLKSSDMMNERIDELELELKRTKEHLQTIIEELQNSNEELKSTNEELQSANEELQSTNEELETSKEELQSTNEELLTVNSELEHKMKELSEASSDMNNLLASTRIATVFLDNNFRIKRFTPEISGIINMIQSDIGRPLSDIASKIEYPDWQKTPRRRFGR